MFFQTDPLPRSLISPRQPRRTSRTRFTCRLLPHPSHRRGPPCPNQPHPTRPPTIFNSSASSAASSLPAGSTAAARALFASSHPKASPRPSHPPRTPNHDPEPLPNLLSSPHPTAPFLQLAHSTSLRRQNISRQSGSLVMPGSLQ